MVKKKLKMVITPRQEKFAQIYVQTGNATEAYRQVYKVDKMKPSTINRKAKYVIDTATVQRRVQEIQATLAQQSKITVERITKMYLADRDLAHEMGNPGAAVSATTGLARLYGLDKQVHHVQNDPMAELLQAIAGSSVGPPSERGKNK